MNYVDIIQNSLDYIEDNLKTELNAKDLADQSGFSVFHYYRIFQKAVGIAVMQYVLRRRLIHAIYEISQGCKMIDVALSYGFDTHAGFFRAFKREFGESPSSYLSKHPGVRPYKINLMQEEHIMITQKKVNEILEKYWNLNEVKLTNVYYDNNGQLAEDVWYVNDAYVIKSGTNLTGVQHHISVSKALSEAGLQAAVPVPTKDGEDFIVEEDIYYCLMVCLKGECIKSGDCYEGNYKEKARYLGEIIGQLHQVLQKYDSDILCNEPNMLDHIKDWAIPKTKELMQLPQSFYHDYQNVFGELYPKLPKHIIHRDPNPGNIIVLDGRLSGFIDFELLERNIRLFDPCYTATAILSDCYAENSEDKRSKWLSIYRNILVGYDNIVKLSQEERQALPYVIFSIQLIFVAYCDRYDKLSELGVTNQRMLQWLYENKESLYLD